MVKDYKKNKGIIKKCTIQNVHDVQSHKFTMTEWRSIEKCNERLSSQVKYYMHSNLTILNFSNIITIPIKHLEKFMQCLHLSRDDLQIRKMLTVMDRHTSDTCGLAKSQNIFSFG